MALLHVAGYYGCDRLVHLCEVSLGRMLRGSDEAEGARAPARPLPLPPPLL